MINRIFCPIVVPLLSHCCIFSAKSMHPIGVKLTHLHLKGLCYDVSGRIFIALDGLPLLPVPTAIETSNASHSEPRPPPKPKNTHRVINMQNTIPMIPETRDLPNAIAPPPAASPPQSSWGSSCSTGPRRSRRQMPPTPPSRTRLRTPPWPSVGGSTPAASRPRRATGERHRRRPERRREARQEPMLPNRGRRRKKMRRRLGGGEKRVMEQAAKGPKQVENLDDTTSIQTRMTGGGRE